MGEAKRRREGAKNGGSGVIAAAVPPGNWPLTNTQILEQVQHTLSRQRISFESPGFHDSPAFLAAERADSTFIYNLARFVEARRYSVEELNTAAAKIEIAAEAVRAAVQADGRPGLCVTASGILSRMLDALGIWNYCAKSTLTIRFPPDVSRSPRFFYAIDEGNFESPHSIVVAPPYTVIDLTVKHQAYDKAAMSTYLPQIVMSRSFNAYSWHPEDIVAPNVRPLRMKNRNELERFLSINSPQMHRTMNALPAREVQIDGGGVLQYVLTGVGGYAEQLHELVHENSRINGRRAQDIFAEDVLPRV